MTEGEMVGWHHSLDGYDFEKASGVGDGQGSLMCCRPWGPKELDTTEQLNSADPVLMIFFTVALSCGLKSGSLLPPALFFFPKIALAIWGILCFHTNCKVFTLIL